MDDWNIESVKTIAIFITAFIACANLSIALYEKLLRRPKLEVQIESAKLIEDYPGELGIQINAVFRAYNGSFFLKDFEVKNTNKKINKISESTLEVREYVCEDIIEKYLESQELNANTREKEERKLDQFIYDTQLQLNIANLRTGSTGNFTLPDITSDFQNSLRDLCRKAVIHENRYREISKKVESVRDLKIDDSVCFSFTLFAHIYGRLDRNTNEREHLPLDGWKIIIKHSEGRLERKLKAEKISYSQVKDLINSAKGN